MPDSLEPTEPGEARPLAPPELLGEPETARIRAHVIAQLFGEDTGKARIGRFTVEARVGAGAMGVVYACHDAQLDRLVAVKLLRGDRESVTLRERTVREAQAMAKLNHPNVVHVYEVGEHDGRLFVAMELVAGRTLREWLHAERRAWSTVLAVVADAGRGLAAAHAAGLTHRDFKLDNVLVGDDGRVRVTDFGLVRLGESATTIPSGHDASLDTGRSLELTRSGALLGTPAYMAPEQLARADAGPAADQFAFCVTLWECLYGERPFRGATPWELVAAIEAGPAKRRYRDNVPAWLHAALLRGLAIDPEARWPSLTDLLAVLDAGGARARRRRVVLALATSSAIVAGTIAAFAWRAHAHETACAAEADAITQVWNDDARARVRDGILATGASFAPSSADRVAHRFDAQASAWQRARLQACRSDELHERASWCLDDRREELAAAVEVLAGADADLASQAIDVATGLAPIDSCLAPELLARVSLPPEDSRTELRELYAELALLETRGRTAPQPRLLDDAEQLIARARALDFAPAIAEALVARAVLESGAARHEDAERTATEAFFIAERSDAWTVAARAAIELTKTTGAYQQRSADGMMWNRHAEIAVAHAGEQAGLREASRLGALALVHMGDGSYDEASTALDAALAIEEPLLGADHPRIADHLTMRAGCQTAKGDPEAAVATNTRALAIMEAAYGRDHPRLLPVVAELGAQYYYLGEYEHARAFVLRTQALTEASRSTGHPIAARNLVFLALIDAATGRVDEALAGQQRARALLEQALGPEHPAIANSLRLLGDAQLAKDAVADAKASYERALAIDEAAFGPEHPMVAEDLQYLAKAKGPAEAQRLYERALAIVATKFGADSAEYAEALARSADAQRGAAALELHHRALAIFERVRGPLHPRTAGELTRVGELELAEGHSAAALPHLERAVAVFEQRKGLGVDEYDARFALARALATGERATALAENAREGYRTAGKSTELAAVEAWLAERR